MIDKKSVTGETEVLIKVLSTDFTGAFVTFTEKCLIAAVWVYARVESAVFLVYTHSHF